MTFRNARTSLFAAALLVSAAGAAQVQAQSQDASTQLAALARDARTEGQHADVARRYRQQAEALDARAVEQEKLAATQARNAPAIVHKWPSMAPKALTEAKQKAIEYRRAALESREIADRHYRLAVEARAN
ncbi:MAG: hypothetical protein AB7O28_26220 [Vicinamibacterales bacterium]